MRIHIVGKKRKRISFGDSNIHHTNQSLVQDAFERANIQRIEHAITCANEIENRYRKRAKLCI